MIESTWAKSILSKLDSNYSDFWHNAFEKSVFLGILIMLPWMAIYALTFITLTPILAFIECFLPDKYLHKTITTNVSLSTIRQGLHKTELALRLELFELNQIAIKDKQIYEDDVIQLTPKYIDNILPVPFDNIPPNKSLLAHYHWTPKDLPAIGIINSYKKLPKYSDVYLIKDFPFDQFDIKRLGNLHTLIDNSNTDYVNQYPSIFM